MRRVALGILVAAFVVACLPPSGRLFHTTLTTPDGSYSLPVTLGDQTNLVVGFEPGPTDPFPDVEPTVRSDPADPKAMILTWVGGACEDETVVVFHPGGGRYDLAVSPRGGLLGSCPAIGILRAVRIRTSEPVAMDLIDVIGRREASPNT
jgi:hypothetical protein